MIWTFLNQFVHTQLQFACMFDTLGNKDFGALDILTDSSCIGSPHTQMNTRLAQLGQIFPQISFFRPFLRYTVKVCIVSISRFQCKNRF